MFFASFAVSGRAFHSTGPLKLKVFLSNSDFSLFTCSLLSGSHIVRKLSVWKRGEVQNRGTLMLSTFRVT